MRTRYERAEASTFSANPSRPGRLVAATACPGRHETPGDAPRTAAVLYAIPLTCDHMVTYSQSHDR